MELTKKDEDSRESRINMVSTNQNETTNEEDIIENVSEEASDPTRELQRSSILNSDNNNQDGINHRESETSSPKRVSKKRSTITKSNPSPSPSERSKSGSSRNSSSESNDLQKSLIRNSNDILQTVGSTKKISSVSFKSSKTERSQSGSKRNSSPQSLVLQQSPIQNSKDPLQDVVSRESESRSSKDLSNESFFSSKNDLGQSSSKQRPSTGSKVSSAGSQDRGQTSFVGSIDLIEDEAADKNQTQSHNRPSKASAASSNRSLPKSNVSHRSSVRNSDDRRQDTTDDENETQSPKRSSKVSGARSNKSLPLSQASRTSPMRNSDDRLEDTEDEENETQSPKKLSKASAAASSKRSLPQSQVSRMATPSRNSDDRLEVGDAEDEENETRSRQRISKASVAASSKRSLPQSQDSLTRPSQNSADRLEVEDAEDEENETRSAKRLSKASANSSKKNSSQSPDHQRLSSSLTSDFYFQKYSIKPERELQSTKKSSKESFNESETNQSQPPSKLRTSTGSGLGSNGISSQLPSEQQLSRILNESHLTSNLTPVLATPNLSLALQTSIVSYPRDSYNALQSVHVQTSPAISRRESVRTSQNSTQEPVINPVVAQIRKESTTMPSVSPQEKPGQEPYPYHQQSYLKKREQDNSPCPHQDYDEHPSSICHHPNPTQTQTPFPSRPIGLQHDTQHHARNTTVSYPCVTPKGFEHRVNTNTTVSGETKREWDVFDETQTKSDWAASSEPIGMKSDWTTPQAIGMKSDWTTPPTIGMKSHWAPSDATCTNPCCKMVKKERRKLPFAYITAAVVREKRLADPYQGAPRMMIGSQWNNPEWRDNKMNEKSDRPTTTTTTTTTIREDRSGFGGINSTNVQLGDNRSLHLQPAVYRSYPHQPFSAATFRQDSPRTSPLLSRHSEPPSSRKGYTSTTTSHCFEDNRSSGRSKSATTDSDKRRLILSMLRECTKLLELEAASESTAQNNSNEWNNASTYSCSRDVQTECPVSCLKGEEGMESKSKFSRRGTAATTRPPPTVWLGGGNPKPNTCMSTISECEQEETISTSTVVKIGGHCCCKGPNGQIKSTTTSSSMFLVSEMVTLNKSRSVAVVTPATATSKNATTATTSTNNPPPPPHASFIHPRFITSSKETTTRALIPKCTSTTEHDSIKNECQRGCAVIIPKTKDIDSEKDNTTDQVPVVQKLKECSTQNVLRHNNNNPHCTLNRVLVRLKTTTKDSAHPAYNCKEISDKNCAIPAAGFVDLAASLRKKSPRETEVECNRNTCLEAAAATSKQQQQGGCYNEKMKKFKKYKVFFRSRSKPKSDTSRPNVQQLGFNKAEIVGGVERSNDESRDRNNMVAHASHSDPYTATIRLRCPAKKLGVKAADSDQALVSDHGDNMSIEGLEARIGEKLRFVIERTKELKEDIANLKLKKLCKEKANK